MLYEQVKTYFKEGDEFNWVRIAYIAGYSIAFIGTMFIPIAGWVGKIAKVDKLIPDELLKMLKTSGETIAKQLNAQSRNAQLRVLQQCAELLEIFAKGKQAIKEFFTKLGDDIGTWLVRNREAIENKMVLVVDVKEFLKIYTLTTAQHINYGQVKITKINPKLPKTDPKRIIEKYKYTPKRGRRGGGKFNYKVDVGGMHNLNYLNKYVRLKGELKLLGKLPTGEKVYQGMVEFYISENKAWKTKDIASTFFPKQWSERKIKGIIQEACMNIIYRDRNRYIGRTKNGIQIEFRLNLDTREIETAFITFEKFY